jgi:hypothetical protein
MEITKKELHESILTISRFIGSETTYHNLINSIGVTMPELVKIIIYDMFVNEAMICDNQSPEYLQALNNLHAYTSELKLIGFVSFK